MNYFRASLPNITADGNRQLNSVVDLDYLPYSFLGLTLTGRQQALYNYLFPVSADRSGTILYANAYTNLLHVYDLDEVFTHYDPAINYQLSDLNRFNDSWLATNTLNLQPVINNINNA